MRRFSPCCVALLFLLAAADDAQAARWLSADPGEFAHCPAGHSDFETVDPDPSNPRTKPHD
jgi:hypothetical protein